MRWISEAEGADGGEGMPKDIIELLVPFLALHEPKALLQELPRIIRECSNTQTLHGIFLLGSGAERVPCPVGSYLPLHQPSAALWLYHVLPSLPWFSFIGTPCLGHCGVSAVAGPSCAWSHWLAASPCTLTLAKSVPRKVTSTSCPWRVALSVMLTGASGSGVVETVGEACGEVGWLGAVAWPFAGASSGARTRAATRLA